MTVVLLEFLLLLAHGKLLRRILGTDVAIDALGVCCVFHQSLLLQRCMKFGQSCAVLDVVQCVLDPILLVFDPILLVFDPILLVFDLAEWV